MNEQNKRRWPPQFGHDFNATRQAMGQARERSRRRRETIASVLIGVVFACLCWGVYHALKAKGWLP